MLSLSNMPQLIFSVAAAFIALCIHEFAHALAAYKLGDNTAERNGRLSLNPLHHLDPVGAIFMVLFRFGWAKPVPINPINFKKPKRDFAIVALAGPTSNIILAFFSAPIFLLFFKLAIAAQYGTFAHTALYNTCIFFTIFTALNVGLGIFNLIPIPPFDGSRILNVVLPEKAYFKVMRYERRIYFGFLIWLLVGDVVYSTLMSLPIISSAPILSGALKIFDLSGLIGKAIDFIYSAIISLWQLIPALS